MQEIITHTIADSLPILPLLFIAYLLIEYYEHRKNASSEYVLLEKYGPLVGAFLGVVPQCGFGVVAATMFLDRKITIGTLISVFIATSDEALPILLSNPELFDSVIQLILVKIAIAIVTGYIVDMVFTRFKLYNGNYTTNEVDSCATHSNIWMCALKQTMKIFAFILIVNFTLTFILHEIGEETLSLILLSDTVFQPIVAAVFGFIPNCMASVVLTQLYANGIVSFGALIAGLVTNAGLGLLVLLRYRIDKKYFLLIVGVLFAVGMLSGILLELL